MKLKERKGNESEKQVKPVKKSVALTLTIVTVFAFAAVCFSFGYCSGKKVEQAYALDVTVSSYFYIDTIPKAENATYAFDFESNGLSFSSVTLSLSGSITYTTVAGSDILVFDDTYKWTEELYRYIYVPSGEMPMKSYSWLSSNAFNTADAVLYAGTYTWVDSPTFWNTGSSASNVRFSSFFSSGGSSFDTFRSKSPRLAYYNSDISSATIVYDEGEGGNFWDEAYRTIVFESNATFILSSHYSAIINNFDSFSSSSAPEPVEYTATVDYPNEVNFEINPVAGEGVIYNDTSGIFTGSEGGTFTFEMVPSSGYRIGTFLVADVVNNPTGTVTKTSTSLYTCTFGAGNMELVITASASLITYSATLDEKTTGSYSFGYIEGPGTTYDENAEIVTGAPGTYFQVQLMPFEGYTVDTFTCTDSDGGAQSIVKVSSTLYTITIGNEDFVLNISATVKIAEYTLTCEYEGAQNYTVTYGVIGDITYEGNVFTGQPGASAYVRITPNDGYIMRSLSYQITDGEVLSVTPGSSNNYTIVLTSSDATILFSVVATAQTVDISSGYYWIQCRNYGTDFSELTLQSGQFQIVESVSSSGIVWQDLTGLVCEAGKISFRFSGDKRISVYTVTETHDDFSLSSGVVISDQGNIVAGYDYDYYSTLWAANWYPVIYVPSNIMEDKVSDALVSFFKSSSVYKADPVYYNGFYLTKKDTIANSNAFYNTYLGIYVPVANTLVSPSSVSFVPDSGGVSNITYKSALNFMGDVSSGEYVIYCGYNYNYNSTVSYNRVGRIPPAPRAGTYMESIYIYPTIMPERLYNLMASWFDIASGPVVPDPPPSSYWEGLDEVLSYKIFGIPLSSLLAIVISSVFVVVVIRLFAGG